VWPKMKYLCPGHISNKSLSSLLPSLCNIIQKQRKTMFNGSVNNGRSEIL
jgi:hypothetical protein